MEINKLVKPIPIFQSKAYYPRKSPIDLQYDEKIPVKVKYEGNAIHEWSIDDLSEYKIIWDINNMLIFASARKVHHTLYKIVALALISGFVGPLQGW